jgi:hypothetical protein
VGAVPNLKTKVVQMKMEKSEFDFWKDHSLHYLEMAFRTEGQH